jgi:hypothetical protein
VLSAKKREVTPELLLILPPPEGRYSEREKPLLRREPALLALRLD